MFLYCAVVIGLCTCLFLPWKRERQLCRGCTVHTCFGGYLRKKKWRLTPLFANTQCRNIYPTLFSSDLSPEGERGPKEVVHEKKYNRDCSCQRLGETPPRREESYRPRPAFLFFFCWLACLCLRRQEREYGTGAGAVPHAHSPAVPRFQGAKRYKNGLSGSRVAAQLPLMFSSLLASLRPFLYVSAACVLIILAFAPPPVPLILLETPYPSGLFFVYILLLFHVSDISFCYPLIGGEVAGQRDSPRSHRGRFRPCLSGGGDSLGKDLRRRGVQHGQH